MPEKVPTSQFPSIYHEMTSRTVDGPSPSFTPSPSYVPPPPPAYVTKDSGARDAYDSGMTRDTQDGKARFDLLRPKGVPYAKQFLTRVAELMTRGAVKYGFRNWEKANSEDELERFQNSAERHLMQWLAGEEDEDHAAAVVFNILAAETVKYKMQ